ncbi:hypothetical protein ACTFIU_003825 [Dictyostelium citrinum]
MKKHYSTFYNSSDNNINDFYSTEIKLKKISHSDSLSSVGSNRSNSNYENKINNGIINDFDSTHANDGTSNNSNNSNNNNNNNNNSSSSILKIHQSPQSILSTEQQHQIQQYQQYHQQQIYESGYVPPHVYIFDPDYKSNNNNNNDDDDDDGDKEKRSSKLIELNKSTDLSNIKTSTTPPPLMIPENEEENKQLRQEILNELSKSESFTKIKEPGEIYGFCECSLLYNHLTCANLVITSNYLIFLPQQQVDSDYVLENYLYKKGDFFWKKYWFVLTPDSISWYKNSILKETHYPNGTILLSKIVTVDKLDPEETGKPFCLQIMTNTSIHLIQLDTEPQLEHWYHEINRMQKNLNVTIPIGDIVSIAMESNAALFFDSLCLTLKKGENCLVTPSSSSNEICSLLIKLWNRNRGVTIVEPEKQQRLLEFQKTFKLSQGVDLLIETPCLFYQDEEFSYDGVLYATSEGTLYFSSLDSVLIIPESDIYAITIDRKSDNRDALKVYTTDYDVLFFDSIDDIETFFNVISTCLARSNPKIFFSTVGQIPPIDEPKHDEKEHKSTYQTISSGIRSWKIPIPSLPNFSIPIPKSIPIPLFRSKSSSHLDPQNSQQHQSSSSSSPPQLDDNNNNNNIVIPHTSNPTSSPAIIPSTSTPSSTHEKTIIIQKNSSINSTFHDIFPLLPLDETVIMFQNCSLYYYSYDSNIEGTVYITKSYIAFNPSPLDKQQQQQQPQQPNSSSSITSTHDRDLDTDSDTDSESDFDYPEHSQHDNSVVMVNNNHYKVKEVLMKKALIPIEDIVSVTKERFLLFFNQCVKIITMDHKWIFGSLNNINSFYNLILETWKQIPKTLSDSSSSNNSDLNINGNSEGSIFTPLESIKIKNKLGLPADEVLITWFNCTNFKGAQLKYGFLYISNNNICFRSKFGFQKRTIIIPLSQVIEIKKYSGFIPNGIKITTASHHEFQFASFIHRNRVYQILYETWLKATNNNNSINNNNSNKKSNSSNSLSSSPTNSSPLVVSPNITSPSSTPTIHSTLPSSVVYSDIQEVIDEENNSNNNNNNNKSSSGFIANVEEDVDKIKKSIKSLPILSPLKIHNAQQQQQQQLQQQSKTTTTSTATNLISPRLLTPLTITQSPGFSSLASSPILPVKPLRITILTIGSRGDIQPFIALSLGLKEYGHNVTLATHELYRDLITKEFGLNYQPLGGDPKELMDLCVRNGIFTPKFIKEALSRFRSFIDDLLLTCWKAVQASNTQVLIATPGCFAGPHIGEALQIPFFNAFTMPFTRTRTYPNPFAPFASHQMGGVFNLATHVMMEKILWQPISGQINQWRTETLKIPPWNSSVSINETYRMPYLYCFSKYLVPKPPDWSGEIAITGYWTLKNQVESDSPPEDLIQFLNESTEKDDIPIYIGFGSIVIDNPTALSLLLIEAIKLSGKRAIISQGWGGLSIDEHNNNENKIEQQQQQNSENKPSSSLPSNRIYLLKKPVDHSWLFEKVSLVISHGGAGTVAASLFATKPTIVVPFFGDQFFWGERIKQTGIGTSIPFDTLTAKSLSSHIISILNEPSVRAKVTKMSHLLKKEDGVKTAIDFIHRYLPFSFIPPREIPFSSAPNSCMGCKQPFTLLHVMKARVHCHCCGKIFCESCTSHKCPIKKYRINTPVRVCDKCYNDLQSNPSSNSFILND